MKITTSLWRPAAVLATGLLLTQLTASAQVLSNRWSFSEPVSSLTVTDSVSQVVGNLSGANASVDGAGTCILGGNSFVSLPGGLITSFSNVTIEAWFTNSSTPDNVCLFEFSDGSGAGTFNGGTWDAKYLRMVVHDNGNTRNFLQYPNGGNPGTGGNTDGRLDAAPGLGDRALHIVCVYDPVGGNAAVYTNGILQSSITGIVAPLTSIPTGSSAIGQSPWWAWGDAYMVGTVSEFRIWHGAFTYSNVLSSFAAGPDALPTGAFPVTIIKQPVGPLGALAPGGSISLVAEAIASALPIAAQWQAGPAGGPYTNLVNGLQANGSTVSGATTTNLSVTGLTLAQNGVNYVLKFTDNLNASVTTVPVAIAVVSAPTVVVDTTPLTFTNYTTKVAKFVATFSGSQPLTYQWQVSTDGGTNYSNISGATSTNLLLTNLQLSQSGLYRLRAINANGTNYSTAATLQVLDLATALFDWRNPVSFNGLSAEQILDAVPGTFVSAAVGNAIGNTTVTTTNGNAYLFASDGSAATLAGGFGSFNFGPGVFFQGETGNSDFNTVLGTMYFDGGAHQLTIHNLTVGQKYSVQLFAIDDRSGPNARLSNYQDPANSQNISATSAHGDRTYILGYFTAPATDVTVQQNLLTGGAGNFTALVVRSVTQIPAEAPPALSLVPQAGGNLRIFWSYGTLLQATNLAGPWVPTGGTSPFTVTPSSAPQIFYRVQGY